MSQEQLSIKLNIGGRVYPLTISMDEEEAMRKAAHDINEKIRAYESQYAVRDKQDLLAMCALEFALDRAASLKEMESRDLELDQQLDRSKKVLNDYLETI
ncbi:MAG: cell division protein ZapA [Flavobacteriales bacterium]|nr:cell division protein ZapA [Flavobacteriales bacterium]